MVQLDILMMVVVLEDGEAFLSKHTVDLPESPAWCLPSRDVPGAYRGEAREIKHNQSTTV